jgi:hypothetical protein
MMSGQRVWCGPLMENWLADSSAGNVWVEAAHRLAQPNGQNHLAVMGTLRLGAVMGNVRALGVAVANFGQPA